MWVVIFYYSSYISLLGNSKKKKNAYRHVRKHIFMYDDLFISVYVCVCV